MDVLQLADAATALEQLGAPLQASGAEGELSYGILARLTNEPSAWGDDVTMLVGMRSGSPAGLVTMTGALPALIVGFTDPGAVDLGAVVATMLELDRRPPGVHGSVRWSEPFAGAWAAVGAQVSIYRDVRAYELRAVRPPAKPVGRMRPASTEDARLLTAWTVAFGEEIREPTSRADAARIVERLIPGNDLAVWERAGEVVSMAAVNRRTPWSSCVGLVYTPPALRGEGFASSIVAELSQRELDAGQAWCSLFTDLANPTSNHIYTAIGYEPACVRHFDLSW